MFDRILHTIEGMLPPVRSRLEAPGSLSLAESDLVAAPVAYRHLDAARTLLLADECASAAVLARTAYEMAVRLLWASLMPDGHERMHAYWMQQRGKWAQDVAKSNANAALIERFERERSLMEERETHSSHEPAPGLRTMLRDIAHHRNDGTVAEASDLYLAQYANVYRYLSAATHGDPGVSCHFDRTWWLLHCAQAAHIVARMLAHALAQPFQGKPVSAYEDFEDELADSWSILEALAADVAKNQRGGDP